MLLCGGSTQLSVMEWLLCINLYEKLHDNHFGHILNHVYNANLVLSVRFLRISEE